MALRIGRIPTRVGSGLERRYRSTAPARWASIGAGEISDRAAIQVLPAGPIATALFAAVLLAARTLVPVRP